ncbi:MAG: DUF1559 domain-containing protein [Pirellulaceae bacterium]
MAKTDRSAFTLTELLVVISIVAILILLVVPAINFARESARRSQCMSNMKRIVFAVQNYERTYGSFPVAVPSCTAEAYNSLGARKEIRAPAPIGRCRSLAIWMQTNFRIWNAA